MRILYVDDDAISVLVFQETLLLHMSLELRVAETCAEALRIAAGWTPDAFVLDAHLPDGDGWTLVDVLRALPAKAGVPIFMCSGDAMPADLQRARDAGLAGYWVKPIDFDAVIADLRRCAAAA
jgi:CheY-like chemotaxis protein